MKRVLFVGFDPATVDFSDPALPPGMTAEKIHAGISHFGGFLIRQNTSASSDSMRLHRGQRFIEC